MEIFIISFVVYLLTAFSIGISILFRGQSMPVGCRGLPENPSCQFKGICGKHCERTK